jgi:hypothetical protein
MTPALNLAAVLLMMPLIVAAYYVGKDEGIDQERRRNARRRAHRHQIEANRPRTTTQKETRQP